MRVHGASGGNPTTEEALRRNAWLPAQHRQRPPAARHLVPVRARVLVAVIAIAVTINSDPLKRGWHDKFANTSVTKEG